MFEDLKQVPAGTNTNKHELEHESTRIDTPIDASIDASKNKKDGVEDIFDVPAGTEQMDTNHERMDTDGGEEGGEGKEGKVPVLHEVKGKTEDLSEQEDGGGIGKKVFVIAGIVVVVVVVIGIGVKFQISNFKFQKNDQNLNDKFQNNDQYSNDNFQNEVEGEEDEEGVEGEDGEEFLISNDEFQKGEIEELDLTETEDMAEEEDVVPAGTIDTDGDGLSDDDEMSLGTSALEVDTDQDGLSDREEIKVYKTDPLNSDTDGDGYLDGSEVQAGYNPKGEGKLLNF